MNTEGGAVMEHTSLEELQFDIYQQLGECYTFTGDIDKALEHFHTARKLMPTSEQPLIGIGTSLIQQKKFLEAEQCFHEALALQPHSDRALAGLALVSQEAGRITESLSLYRQAMDENPTNLTALMGVIQTAYALERFDTAITYLRAYLEHYPANTKILYCLAGTYFKQQQYEKCREVLDQLFIFNPDHPEARELLTMLQRAQGYSYAQCNSA